MTNLFIKCSLDEGYIKLYHNRVVTEIKCKINRDYIISLDGKEKYQIRFLPEPSGYYYFSCEIDEFTRNGKLRLTESIVETKYDYSISIR